MTQAAGLKSVAGPRSRPAAMGLAIQLGEFLQSMDVDVSDVEHLFLSHSNVVLEGVVTKNFF